MLAIVALSHSEPLPCLTEVVLAVLLSSFKFTMNERSKQIVWNMAGIMYPTVGKHSKFAEFPMSLTPLEE